MQLHDEDDDFSEGSRPSRPDDFDDDHFEMKSQDDLEMVKCGGCRKLILEDAPQCPYCKHWQMEEEQTHRPLWFILTAILCIGVMGGFGVIVLLIKLPTLFK